MHPPPAPGSECAIEIGRLLTPEEDAGIPAGRSSRVVSLFVPGNCAFASQESILGIDDLAFVIGKVRPMRLGRLQRQSDGPFGLAPRRKCPPQSWLAGIGRDRRYRKRAPSEFWSALDPTIRPQSRYRDFSRLLSKPALAARSTGAACDDMEYQSQQRHPDRDCSDRQQDFGGCVRPFDGTGPGVEFVPGPIAKTKMTVVPRAFRVSAPG